MRLILTILFSLNIFSGKGQTSDPYLFQFYEGNKTGFIDSAGNVIIEPVFLSAYEFSEGLALARIGGNYGYIDKSGNFVIKPRYDYATPFSDGLAVVYVNATPFYIDKEGQLTFEMNYTIAGPFINGIAKIQTKSKKFGFINKKGKLVIDTVFKRINPFVEGLAVVEGIENNPYGNRKLKIEKKFEIGVIDTSGNFIIPYGTFSEIKTLNEGYFLVEIPAEPWDTVEGDTKRTGFVDRNGVLVFSRDHKNNSWIDGNLYCGLARIHLYKNWIPEKKDNYYTSEKSYEGFINIKGEIVVNDTNYRYVKDYSDNRAFIETNNRDFLIIDTHGNLVAERKFDRVIGNGFANGVAFVKTDRKYGMIDTSGNFLIEPQFEGVDDVGLVDDYFFFYNWNSDDDSYYDKLYGIARKDGSILLEPVMQQFNRNGFVNGLLICQIDHKQTYINKAGKIIWQETENKHKKLENLNIDFMNRGYFCAYSKPNKQLRSNGWAESPNIPHKILRKDHFPDKQLSVIVNPEKPDTIYRTYNAITVYVANTLKNKIDFNAQDSRLYMKVQALNTYGEWEDIEYLPNSWCGNSYHTITLEPKNYWTFLTPVYSGDFKTKLRIELKYIDPEDKSARRRDKKEIIVYSNEYDGSVNPGQFWRKRSYYPNSIMDPYND